MACSIWLQICNKEKKRKWLTNGIFVWLCCFLHDWENEQSAALNLAANKSQVLFKNWQLLNKSAEVFSKTNEWVVKLVTSGQHSFALQFWLTNWIHLWEPQVQLGMQNGRANYRCSNQCYGNAIGCQSSSVMIAEQKLLVALRSKCTRELTDACSYKSQNLNARVSVLKNTPWNCVIRCREKMDKSVILLCSLAVKTNFQ